MLGLEFSLEEVFLPVCDAPLTVSRAAPESMLCAVWPGPDHRAPGVQGDCGLCLPPTPLGPAARYLAGPQAEGLSFMSRRVLAAVWKVPECLVCLVVELVSLGNTHERLWQVQGSLWVCLKAVGTQLGVCPTCRAEALLSAHGLWALIPCSVPSLTACERAHVS